MITKRKKIHIHESPRVVSYPLFMEHGACTIVVFYFYGILNKRGIFYADVENENNYQEQEFLRGMVWGT
jgi:hypothetical protein